MPEKDIRHLEKVTITDLYPDLSPAQQSEAEECLLRYLMVVKRVFERVVREKPELLTVLERRAMLRKKHLQEK